MSRRSNGRNSPSRGARVELRKAERAARTTGAAVLVVPAAIRNLAPPARRRRAPDVSQPDRPFRRTL